MPGSGMNLITTVIGFGMSATFIVFVCTRIICGRLRSAQSNSPNYEIESRVDLEQQPESRASGLEPVLIAAIPTMKFDLEAFSSVEDAQCSICLGEYEEKEVLRIMPKCGHSFHLSCIDVWLRKQSTCPVCRLPLQESFRTKPSKTDFGVGEASSKISGVGHEHNPMSETSIPDYAIHKIKQYREVTLSLCVAVDRAPTPCLFLCAKEISRNAVSSTKQSFHHATQGKKIAQN